VYWQNLRVRYDQVNSEIRYIVTKTGAYSAEYIENKPVQFRRDLVKQLLKAEQEKADGHDVTAKG
jgi:hypothetical protein